ncbi:FtsW/RodA/SpoVE family cell cycle protein [Paenibacillus sp. 481]|uniref:FtsW/RodA/SpoVE family cell cycle protein n=1 Tax=Paenibacillus sp. 481 TaxID=2835869 RepID=UPI001E319889|nr:FtsW/RodA/SpoVE family cell cycle protein [Paenibacillus sp. 481]UHA75473.1 FtsW/RodA/SpoVE family cell cycle protein [Paenibacillus sp. 481]
MSDRVNGFDSHPLIVQYLDRVCGHIKAKAVHEDIRHELLAHLEELAEERSFQDDISLDEKVSGVLKKMGDPEEVGKGLHTAHKPKPEWGVIALVASMVCIALISILALALSNLTGNLSIKQDLLYGFIGIAVMIALYFSDYRKLLRFSWPLYGLTLLVLVASYLLHLYMLFGVPRDALSESHLTTFYMIYVHLFDLSPYLFLISFAGILQLQKERKQEGGTQSPFAKLMVNTGLFALLPILMYTQSTSLNYFVTYCAGLAVLLVVAGNKKLRRSVGVSATVLMGLIVYFGNTSIGSHWIMITSYLNSFRHYFTGQYHYSVSDHSLKLLESAGLWGQGFGMTLPYSPDSGFQFTYAVYSLGWVFGIIVVLVSILFIKRVLLMGALLKDGYARGLVTGLITVLGVQLIWNLLMCMNLLPDNAINLPLMNWGMITVIFEFAIVGLMLSAYRRKDMLSQRQLSGSIE